MLRRSIARPKETSLPLHVQDIPGRRSHGKRRKRTKGSCGNCCRHFNTSVSSVSSHRTFARQHHRGLLLPQRRGTIASYENSRRGVWVAFLLLSFAIIYLVLTSLLRTRHSFSPSHKGSWILIRREQGIYHGVIRPLSFHSIEQDDDESSSDFNDIDTDFLDRVWNRQIHSDPQDSISEVQEYDRHEDGFNFYSDVDEYVPCLLLFFLSRSPPFGFRFSHPLFLHAAMETLIYCLIITSTSGDPNRNTNANAKHLYTLHSSISTVIPFTNSIEPLCIVTTRTVIFLKSLETVNLTMCSRFFHRRHPSTRSY